MTSELPAGSRPRLAGRARLRWDRLQNRELLIYPERGLLLSDTASAIVRLCTGERTVGEIIGELVGRFGEAERPRIERETHDFLKELRARALLELP